MDLDIAQLTDQPTTITIGGQPYLFSEFPLASLGRLQQWIKETIPNPLVAIRKHLATFSEDQQAVLLDQARRDALAWPPKIGTTAGAGALLNNEDGQQYALWVALQVHQPDLTQDDARRLYKQLRREAAAERRRAKSAGREPDKLESDKATRIYAIAFGMDELVESPDPKDGTPGTTETLKSPSAST